MSDHAKAVFLSYASQDAESAQHLANGLRAAGIDVWFDQSELRGGDAWDAMIRKRIKGCTLFVPVVSRNTEARQEGYFRLEWKLAVDRSHLMSEDRAFIVPVVIDDTDEYQARVPEAFRARQWARLLNGEVPQTFVQQIQHLMDLPAGDISRAPAPRVASAAEPTKAAAPPIPWRIVAAVATVVVVGAASFFMGSSSTTTSPAPQASRPAPIRAAEAPAVSVANEPARDAPHSEAETRAAAVSSEKRIARNAQPSNQGLRPVSLEAREAPATVADPQQPLRIVSGAPLAPLEESKHWAVQVELAFWDTIRTSSMTEDYEEYLRQYPNGRFAGLARNRIKTLKSKGS